MTSEPIRAAQSPTMRLERSVTLAVTMAPTEGIEIAHPLKVVEPRAPLAEPRVVAEPRNLTVEAFRALADPVRLELLARVAAHGPICVCHLEEQLPYSQSRISKHLGTLRRAGL